MVERRNCPGQGVHLIDNVRIKTGEMIELGLGVQFVKKGLSCRRAPLAAALLTFPSVTWDGT